MKSNIEKYVYVGFRVIVLSVLIRQLFIGNWNSAFLCVLTLFLFLIPNFLEKRLNVSLPIVLEITILIFIFSAEILGEISNFYGTFKHWDTILHTVNGFLAAAIGFSLIDIINQRNLFHISMSPWFVALVAFCFSMTIGVLWEFFEFAGDQLFNKEMQKDRIIQKISSVDLNPERKNVPVIIENIDHTVIYYQDGDQMKTELVEGGYLDIGIIDTMKDLIVNFVGAVTFSVFGFLYITHRDKFQFVDDFIPKLNEKTVPDK